MHRERGPAAYWRVLRTGAAVRPFALSVLARLPVSMAPLGALLLVQQVQGSYAVAGAVTGAFALGTAAGAPAWARLMDRAGQPRVIALTAVVSGGLLAALATATVAGAAPVALVVTAALAGLTFPPMSPAMRGAWKAVLPPGQLRQAGFALDAVAVETVFVGGPLLLSLLLAAGRPAVPLLTTAGLLLVGGLGYALTPAARGAGRSGRHSPGESARGASGGSALGASGGSAPGASGGSAPGASGGSAPGASGGSALGASGGSALGASGGSALGAAEGSVLGASGLVAVLAVAAAMAVAFGHIDTALAATARERLGDPARLGLLFAAIAGGSATGGLVYGARRWRWRPERQLPLLLGAFGLALAALPAVVATDPVPLVVLLPLLFLAGLPIAPSLIVQQNLVDDLAPSHRSAEAQAWLSSAATTAAAAGTAVCGVLLDVAGVPWALAAAAVAAGCSALVALGAIVGGAPRA